MRQIICANKVWSDYKKKLCTSRNHIFFWGHKTLKSLQGISALSRVLSDKNFLQEFAGDRPIRKPDSESIFVIGQPAVNKKFVADISS